MLTRPFSSLFSITYLGARFKGWAKQAGQPTVEGKLERVLRYVLGHEDFTMLGSSRTDSGVSCRQGFVQIFLREKVDLQELLPEINRHLGGEICLNEVEEIARDFNLIQSVRQKTYRYYFSDSASFHPFSSALLTSVSGINSLDQMQENAALFMGKHDFRAFCKITGHKADFMREILEAKVFEAVAWSTAFSQEKTLCFEVTGTGFLYHQVRKMMHAIWFFTSDQIRARLDQPADSWEPVPTASANGLILWETVIDR